MLINSIIYHSEKRTYINDNTQARAFYAAGGNEIRPSATSCNEDDQRYVLEAWLTVERPILHSWSCSWEAVKVTSSITLVRVLVGS